MRSVFDQTWFYRNPVVASHFKIRCCCFLCLELSIYCKLASRFTVIQKKHHIRSCLHTPFAIWDAFFYPCSPFWPPVDHDRSVSDFWGCFYGARGSQGRNVRPKCMYSTWPDFVSLIRVFCIYTTPMCQGDVDTSVRDPEGERVRFLLPWPQSRKM
jgi:hypothetical protein